MRLLLILLTSSFFVLTGCNLFGPKPSYNMTQPNAVIPQAFLYTTYSPLNRWLDTPKRIIIHDVPLRKVFSISELSPMNYKLVNLKNGDTPVTMKTLGITRRQLLWTIAHEYGLDMTPIYTKPGEPAYIEIRGKGI